MKLTVYWTEWTEWTQLKSGSRRRSRKLKTGKLELADLLQYENPETHHLPGTRFVRYGPGMQQSSVCNSEEAAMRPFIIEED